MAFWNLFRKVFCSTSEGMMESYLGVEVRETASQVARDYDFACVEN